MHGSDSIEFTKKFQLRVISQRVDRMSIQNFIYSESKNQAAGACGKESR